MSNIKFTQYLMPNGRTVEAKINRPDDISDKAKKIIKTGYRFEMEMLSDYQTVSLTIFNLKTEEDDAIELVQNGSAVPIAVDKLINEFEINEAA